MKEYQCKEMTQEEFLQAAIRFINITKADMRKNNDYKGLFLKDFSFDNDSLIVKIGFLTKPTKEQFIEIMYKIKQNSQNFENDFNNFKEDDKNEITLSKEQIFYFLAGVFNVSSVSNLSTNTENVYLLYSTNLTGKKVAEEVIDYVNYNPTRHEDFCKIAANTHPTLQQNIMRLFVEFCQEMAKKQDCTDARNRDAFNFAKKIVEMETFFSYI